MNTPGKYAGRTYSELDPEDQLRFESYEIKADELLNASDEYVLDVVPQAECLWREIELPGTETWEVPRWNLQRDLQRYSH